MSKHKNRQFWPQQQNKPAAEQTPAAATALEDSEAAPEPEIESTMPAAQPSLDDNGLAAGQVYEGVVVPDRKINVMGLPVGYVLPPLVLEGPYDQSADGWWIACVLGESCTKFYVDAEMLEGKLRE